GGSGARGPRTPLEWADGSMRACVDDSGKPRESFRAGSRSGSARPLAAPPYRPGIHGDVDRDDETREPELMRSRQRARIDDGQQVVLDEALAVARLARAHPERILPGG